ncbi:MAG: type II toxin-antitoxin system VapC family toxin [Myxococcaceae bacterium]
MILVDTGPLVALFDPKDTDHERMVTTLKNISKALTTTVPVLTEAFHLLGPASVGSTALREFVLERGVMTWFMSERSWTRAFELMEQYSDRPMDLADASLVAAAEELRTTSLVTLDRGDFSTYRARFGRSHRAFRVLDPA